MLRNISPNTKIKGDDKLAPNWEGLYTIMAEFRIGAYKLADDMGKEVENPWNTIHLKSTKSEVPIYNPKQKLYCQANCNTWSLKNLV